MLKQHLPTIVQATGVALCAAGAFTVAVGLGLVVAGAGLVAFGVAMERGRR